MKIGSVDIKKEVYLIAEAGSNHNGRLHLAKKLISAAAAAGADAVKFQLFSLNTLIQPEAFEKALGIKDSSWRDTLRKLEFKLEWLPVLKRYADQAGVDFLCTAFDGLRMEKYLQTAPVAVKIASGDLTTVPLLRMAGESGLPVILSTGAGKDAEIRTALKMTGLRKTVLLDCVMAYPASAESYGLKRMQGLQKLFNTSVGLSDHTLSMALAVLAVAGGASVVERHFTLDRTRKGADHAMSADPAGFRILAESVRDAVLLRKQKNAKRPDKKERIYARRALYAATKIEKGKLFTSSNCIPLRPADGGIPVAEIDSALGSPAHKEYRKGEPLRPARHRKSREKVDGFPIVRPET